MAPPAGAGGTKYYDDNEWVGIELVRVYELTGEASALEDAEQIMAFVMSGWQANPKLACPGGEPFSNTATNGTRNTVTTAPGAELAAAAVPDHRQRRISRSSPRWPTNGCAPACCSRVGLYADHIGNKGVVETTYWSYNQGTMIGAGVLLYQATGNSGYLYQARQTADAALAYFTSARLGRRKPLLRRRLLPQPALPRLAHRRSARADDRPDLRQLPWQHLTSSSDLFSTGAHTPQLLVQAAIIADLCAAGLSARNLLLGRRVRHDGREPVGYRLSA